MDNNFFIHCNAVSGPFQGRFRTVWGPFEGPSCLCINVCVAISDHMTMLNLENYFDLFPK